MNKRGNVLLSVLIGVLAASVLGITTDEIVQRVYVPINSTSGSMRVTLTGGAAATSMTVGTTTIVGGSNGRLLYDNAGVLGERVNPLAIGFGGTGASSLTGSRCLQTNAGGTAIEVAAAVCGTGAGTVTGTGTAGLIPDWTSSTALGDSAAYRILVPNDAVTGTVTSQLVKLTTTGTVIRTAAAETSGVLGVCISGCGTTGSAVVALMGSAPCDFTNATTAGNYTTVSATVAGECQDTGSTTFPAAGTVVLGVATETGVAGIRSTFLATPDVASAAQGGGGGGNKNPAGAAGDVQYRAASNNFAAESNFNYSASTNRLALTSMTTADDNTTNMFRLTGTLPTTPSTGVGGISLGVTSAGSAAQTQAAMNLTLNAGYTGASSTAGLSLGNAAAGTNANGPNLNSTGGFGGNAAIIASATGVAANDAGVYGEAASATSRNLGVIGKAITANTGANIGVLGNAAASTQGTTVKNVGLYGTLASTIASVNGSFAGFFDGGTLPDAASAIVYTKGTMPAVTTAFSVGINNQITTAGTDTDGTVGFWLDFLPGYTGAGPAWAAWFKNEANGTLSTLNLNGGGGVNGNIGLKAEANPSAAAAGLFAGLVGEATVAGGTPTGLEIGVIGKAVGAGTSTNIGVLGNAAGSTEATDFKNIGGYFTLNSALVAASSISVALVADNGAIAAPIFNAYDNGVLVASIVDGGVIDADIGILGPVPTAQTIAAGNTIAADACGGVKRITASSGVTTDTTNTFTAPAAANAGCAMQVCNEGANAITLDDNANFHSPANADFAVAAGCCIPVASSGASGFWRATATGVCAD